MRICIGIIGIGRFGINYLRAFNKLDGAQVSWICSRNKNNLDKIRNEMHLSAKATVDYKDILMDKDVDAVAIVTPAATHYKIAKEALLAGKHVIVEKPVTTSSKECGELIRISKRKNKVFMAAHIHRYNPGIQKLKEDIDAGKFGNINFLHYTHLGNGPVRADINALWDFFPHALTICNYLFDEIPISVSANRACFFPDKIQDIASVGLKYKNGAYATATVSWLYPFKRMELAVSGEKLSASFDDYASEEKLKYYGNAPKIMDGKPIIAGKGYTPQDIGKTRPLTAELEHFLDCVRNNKEPLTGGNEALKVIKILEYAQKSLDKGGREVEVRL